MQQVAFVAHVVALMASRVALALSALLATSPVVQMALAPHVAKRPANLVAKGYVNISMCLYVTEVTSVLFAMKRATHVFHVEDVASAVVKGPTLQSRCVGKSMSLAPLILEYVQTVVVWRASCVVRGISVEIVFSV